MASLPPEFDALNRQLQGKEPHDKGDIEHRLYFFLGITTELTAVIEQENALLFAGDGRVSFRDPMFIARKQKLFGIYENLAIEITQAAKEGKIRNHTLKNCLIEKMQTLRELMKLNGAQHEVLLRNMQSRVDNIMTRIDEHEASKSSDKHDLSNHLWEQVDHVIN